MFFFFASRRRHTRCALVTGVQTCALPISGEPPGGLRIEPISDSWRVNPTERSGGIPNSVSRRPCKSAKSVHPVHDRGGIYRGVGPDTVNGRGGFIEIGRATWRDRVCQYV